MPFPDGGKKKPLRFEHRRGGSFVSDQAPRGSSSDETMTTAAEETAPRAAIEAVRERFIDAGRECRPTLAVKPKTGDFAARAGINGNLGYSNGQ